MQAFIMQICNQDSNPGQRKKFSIPSASSFNPSLPTKELQNDKLSYLFFNWTPFQMPTLRQDMDDVNQPPSPVLETADPDLEVEVTTEENEDNQPFPLLDLPEVLINPLMEIIGHKNYGGPVTLLNLRLVCHQTLKWVDKLRLPIKRRLFSPCVVHLDLRSFKEFATSPPSIPYTNFKLSNRNVFTEIMRSFWKDMPVWQKFLTQCVPNMTSIELPNKMLKLPHIFQLKLFEAAAKSLEKITFSMKIDDQDSGTPNQWNYCPNTIQSLNHIHIPRRCLGSLGNCNQCLHAQVLRTLVATTAPNLKTLKLEVYLWNYEELETLNALIRLKDMEASRTVVSFTFDIHMRSETQLSETQLTRWKDAFHQFVHVVGSSSFVIDICGIHTKFVTLLRREVSDQQDINGFLNRLRSVQFWNLEISGPLPLGANRLTSASCRNMVTPQDLKNTPPSLNTLTVFFTRIVAPSFPSNLRHLDIMISVESVLDPEEYSNSLLSILGKDCPHLEALKIRLVGPLTKKALLPDLQGIPELRHLEMNLYTGKPDIPDDPPKRLEAVLSSVAQLKLYSFNLTYAGVREWDINILKSTMQTVLDGHVANTLRYVDIQLPETPQAAKLAARAKKNLKLAMERGEEPRVRSPRTKSSPYFNFDRSE